MFNVEPQEHWDAKEAAEFEKHVAVRHRRMIQAAIWAGAALLVDIFCIGPFLYGHSLHRYWEAIGKYLLMLALGLLLLVLIQGMPGLGVMAGGSGYSSRIWRSGLAGHH